LLVSSFLVGDFMNNAFSFFLALGFSSVAFSQSQTFLKAPEAPVYETCAKIEQFTGGRDDQSSYKIDDPACTQRNAIKQRDYSGAVTAYQRAQRMLSGDASASTEPKLVLEECGTDVTTGQQDYSCQIRNQQNQHDYSIQKSAWDQMKNDEALAAQQATASEEQRLLAEMKAKSATEALQLAAQKNQAAADKSGSAAGITAGISAGLSAQFAATCATVAGCQYGYLAASIAFQMMSAKNSKQAAENAYSGYNACLMNAQLSSSTSSCGVAPVAFDPTKPNAASLSKIFDSNGNCISAKPEECTAIKNALPAGLNIKDVLSKSSSFATDPLFKTNKDGTVTTKDGKTYKPSDFESVESLKAAGLSEAQAQAALSSINKATAPGSGLDNLKNDLKSKTADKPTDFGGFAISGSGTETIRSNDGKNGAGGTLGSRSIGGSENAQRTPAGEGLVRDFNGETIGVAGDDIFSMMNRRYKTKTVQGSFISY
jgi:hypothetical protein